MEEVTTYLKNLKGRTLLLTHHNADLDAVTSIIVLKEGLAQLGINCDLGVPESIAKPTQKVARGYTFIIDPDCDMYDNVILVETTVPEQLSSVKNLHVECVIDHHPPGPLSKNVISWIDPNSKSTVQMSHEILQELGCEITPTIAKVVAAGLVGETAHLRIAGLREFKLLVEMMETGYLQFEDILKLIETEIDDSERIASLRAASRLQLYRIGSLIVVTSRVGSHEAQACRALVKMGADIAIVIDEKKEEVRISSRARPKISSFGIDLSEIFKAVGEIIGGTGGGHALAGSANGGNRTKITEATEYIIKSLSKAVGEHPKKLE